MQPSAPTTQLRQLPGCSALLQFHLHAVVRVLMVVVHWVKGGEPVNGVAALSVLQ